MATKSTLNLAEREEAVLSLLRKEEPVAALSRRYQVSEQTLYRWRDEFLAGGRERIRGKRSRSSSNETREITKLKKQLAHRAQVIGELSLANDILKQLRESPD